MSCRGRRTGDNHQVMGGGTARKGAVSDGGQRRCCADVARKKLLASQALGQPSRLLWWCTWSYFATSASAEHEGLERVFWEGGQTVSS